MNKLAFTTWFGEPSG